jgi:LPXTG-motif cell wall-anchored protein
MKKIVCMLLVLALIFSLTAVAYAVPTVGDTVYDEEEIIDEDVARGDAQGDSGTGIETSDVDTSTGVLDTDTRTITDEATPGGSAKLPKTGGIPAELFYVVGGLLIVSALLITVKRSKASAKS